MSVTLARRSQGPAGQEFNNASDFPAVSSDGAYVVFSTDATNSFLLDNNGVVDIWRQSLVGTLDRVSLTSSGLPTNDASFSPAISADGRYVAFTSLATNLSLNDGNGFADVFRKDMVTGAVTLVSASLGGLAANSVSFAPTISSDGRYVAYLSAATNLLDGDLNNSIDSFVADLATGTTRLVSTAEDGTQASAGSINRPSISADGRYVAFDSAAANLTAADSNSRDDVFVKDLLTGAVRRASEGGGGEAMGGGFEGTLRPALSADGRYVVFATAAALLAADTNGVLDIYRKDLATGGLALVSLSSAGQPGNAESRDAAISANGRLVTFSSLASNFADGDGAGSADIFVKDMVTGGLTLLSRTQAGAPGFGQSVNPAISADGSVVAFASTAGDLVTGDGNAAQDVFAAALGPPAGTITGTTGADSLLGTDGADTLLGLAGDDTLQGFEGPDRLEGGDGNDLMLGGPGNDAMIGGPGDDAYLVDGAGDLIIELEDGGNDTAFVAITGYALPANVETARLTGTAAVAGGGDLAQQLVANPDLASQLSGGGGDDVLYGQNLDDTLSGGLGDDILIGGGGNDSMVGGPGNDQAVIDQLGDLFVEDSDGGYDVAYIGVQGATLPVNVEVGRLGGTATLLLGSSGGQSLVANAIYGGILLGGDGGDTLYGSALGDTLDGGAGDDILRGGAGNDVMRGGSGNDTYVIEEAGDVVEETSGADTAYVAVDDYLLSPGIEVAYLAGTATRLYGSDSAEALVASPLFASSLDGRGGSDTLYGSPYGDVLAGGIGDDLDWGSGGADLFVFHIANWGQDVVMDFNRAEGDKLYFRGSGATGFAQLTVATDGQNTTLGYGGNDVTLYGVTSVSAADCVF